MATYTITLNERTSSGKALMEYLKALGVLMHKVSPTAVTKTKEYDITKTADFKAAKDDVKNGRVTTYDSVDDLFEKLGINV
jgi:hypothetical protein